jgi:hypothetical protein
LGDRIQARALAREEARKSLQSQYEAKRLRECEEALRVAEAESAILLHEKRKREAQLKNLTLKNDVRKLEQERIKAQEAIKWSLAVKHHERGLLKYCGLFPWRKVVLNSHRSAAAVQQGCNHRQTKALWLLWKAKVALKRRVRWTCSVAKVIALARFLWHCFKRLLFLRWRDGVRFKRRQAYRAQMQYVRCRLLHWKRRVAGRISWREESRRCAQEANAARLGSLHARRELHDTFRWWLSRWSRRTESRQREQFRANMQRRVVELLEKVRAPS